jgi:uncharacterized protein YheU (UPF0270 family)
VDSHSHGEEGVEVPVERIPPDTLYNMLADYVSREWSELTDAGFTHEDKIEQVQQQLKVGKARVLFDFKTSTWNIVADDDFSKKSNDAVSVT